MSDQQAGDPGRDRRPGPVADPDEVIVRSATGDDLDAVLDVGRRTWPPTYEPVAGADYVQMGLAKWWTADAVIPSIRRGRTLVAEVAGVVVGVATHGVLGEDLVLWKLYVLPGHQGHGVGRRLLKAVCDRAVEFGHPRIVLSHLDGNEQARAFYARHGFVETHRESGGSGLPTNVWVALDLTAYQESA
ncbi:MAG: GNAT family N-acetyltransferase [Micrococcales bacterium]|nr:GNAT family N-acetyltransferase [Micrococcales bacterium]